MTVGLKRAGEHWKAITLIASMVAVGITFGVWKSSLVTKEDVNSIVGRETKGVERIPAIERKQEAQGVMLRSYGEAVQWQNDRLWDLSRERGFAGSRARPRPIPPPPKIATPDAAP